MFHYSSRINQNGQQPFQITSLSPKSSLRLRKQVIVDQTSIATTTTDSQTSSCNEDTKVEVFLGGSCNPTTWRADVAIPELQKLGISFYNPVRIYFNFLRILKVLKKK